MYCRVGIGGNVEGRAPLTGLNAKTSLTETLTGFKFRPEATKDVDNWKCLLLNPRDELVATVTIPVYISVL